MELRYPAVVKRGKNEPFYLVRFPDLPEALTDGRNLNEALDEAVDCLAEALASRLVRGDEIPEPTASTRIKRRIPVPLDLAPKVALYIEMKKQGVSKSALARRLGCRETVVRRLLDPKHHSKADRLEAALKALGVEVVVSVAA